MEEKSIINKLGITQGPWKMLSDWDFISSISQDSADAPNICTMNIQEAFQNLETSNNNAALIATAPEMLEALIDIISKFQSIVPTNTKYVKEYQDQFLEQYDTQIKAIEKATGKSWPEIKEKL